MPVGGWIFMVRVCAIPQLTPSDIGHRWEGVQSDENESTLLEIFNFVQRECVASGSESCFPDLGHQ